MYIYRTYLPTVRDSLDSHGNSPFSKRPGVYSICQEFLFVANLLCFYLTILNSLFVSSRIVIPLGLCKLTVIKDPSGISRLIVISIF